MSGIHEQAGCAQVCSGIRMLWAATSTDLVRLCSDAVHLTSASNPGGPRHCCLGASLHWGAPVALVGSQVAEAAPTLLAAVGRGPAVDPLVGVQVPQFFEAAAALGTGVGALARVHPLVSLEPREDGEAFPTLRAGEGTLGPAMHQPVALEAGGMAESLPTLGTGKRLLPGVDALVLPQIAQVVKVAAAVAALVASLDFDLLPYNLAGSTSVVGTPSTAAGLTIAIYHGGAGRAQGLEGVSLGCIRVDQFDVFLEERSVGAESSTQRADVRGALELRPYKHNTTSVTCLHVCGAIAVTTIFLNRDYFSDNCLQELRSATAPARMCLSREHAHPPATGRSVGPSRAPPSSSPGELGGSMENSEGGTSESCAWAVSIPLLCLGDNSSSSSSSAPGALEHSASFITATQSRKCSCLHPP